MTCLFMNISVINASIFLKNWFLMMPPLPARIAALGKHTSSCLPALIRAKAAASLPARAARAVLAALAGIVPPAAGIKPCQPPLLPKAFFF
jgi:hypothetical protein